MYYLCCNKLLAGSFTKKVDIRSAKRLLARRKKQELILETWNSLLLNKPTNYDIHSQNTTVEKGAPFRQNWQQQIPFLKTLFTWKLKIDEIRMIVYK